MRNLLEVRGLTVELPTRTGWVRPVNDVSLHIAAGESLGLVGESGSGKTMLALALMGLLPPGARVSGRALLAGHGMEASAGGAPRGPGQASPVPAASSDARRSGKDLTTLSEREWRDVRGREIAMVFQEPMTSLNPVMRIGAQIEEAIRAHESSLSAGDVRRGMIEALRRATVPEPEMRAEQFPHQLSGGLRQRAMIAMALAGGSGGQNGEPSAGPRLLIADEPTTALDVTVQKQILELLDRLRNRDAAGTAVHHPRSRRGGAGGGSRRRALRWAYCRRRAHAGSAAEAAASVHARTARSISETGTRGAHADPRRCAAA